MNILTFVAAILLAAPFATLAQGQVAVGEVALVTGSVTVATGAEPRRLSPGDPIFEGQSITVAHNSYANLKFLDGGRVLLRPNTEFTVESFKYQAPAAVTPAAGAPAAPASAEGTAFFRLVRGGFRAISGLIGKANRQSYKVTTPVATIGIRGTDYEVELCAGDCPARSQASAGGTLVAATELSGLELAQAGGASGGGGAGGVIAATHEGSIEVKVGNSVLVLDAGQVGVMLASGQFYTLPAVPDTMLRDPAPDPSACE